MINGVYPKNNQNYKTSVEEDNFTTVYNPLQAMQ